MCINKLTSNVKTHWQWYKGFFGITILRYLVTWFAVVPIVGSLLHLRPDIKIGSFEFSLVTSSSVSDSLKVLWLSSFFFVIALLLYQFFCPGFIKTYASYGDYAKHQHSPRWIIWEAIKVLNDKTEIPKLFDRLHEKGYVETTLTEFKDNYVNVEKKQTAAYFKYKGVSYRLALPCLNSQDDIDSAKTKIVEQEIFWEIFGRFSSSKRTIRFIIILLLIISAFLFFYTLYEHILNGFKILN